MLVERLTALGSYFYLDLQACRSDEDAIVLIIDNRRTMKSAFSDSLLPLPSTRIRLVYPAEVYQDKDVWANWHDLLPTKRPNTGWNRGCEASGDVSNGLAL